MAPPESRVAATISRLDRLQQMGVGVACGQVREVGRVLLYQAVQSGLLRAAALLLDTHRAPDDAPVCLPIACAMASRGGEPEPSEAAGCASIALAADDL